jgi:hypothetical protein
MRAWFDTTHRTCGLLAAMRRTASRRSSAARGLIARAPCNPAQKPAKKMTDESHQNPCRDLYLDLYLDPGLDTSG